ncbi:hypothetical protein Mgra_00005207 [Meloidogyne graminicola]|uniref:Uncharacterized protein n=1 Tax=Meloidogyne graminicola TaxID=189291 RepID=A0A8S9ZPA3_9BILA|nr:hypothetical protein Mgra_00005207 [Meloidogyne graminicola]
MPRTIEHKIKIIGSSNPSGNVSEYGTIEREKNGTLNSQENKKSLNRKADEISYGTECFERNLHYSPNEIEREQFSCRNFGEHYSLGNKAKNLRHQNEHKPEAIKVNYNYDNSNPFSHPIHNDDEYVFESDEDISENEIKGKEESTDNNEDNNEIKDKSSFNYKNDPDRPLMCYRGLKYLIGQEEIDDNVNCVRNFLEKSAGMDKFCYKFTSNSGK